MSDRIQLSVADRMRQISWREFVSVGVGTVCYVLMTTFLPENLAMVIVLLVWLQNREY